jgi:CRISPR-associated protein Cas2
MKEKYIVLIIYDISNDKQRRRVDKYLQKYGTRVQKSAFESIMTKNLYEEMIRGLKIILNEEDDIRIYKLYDYDNIKLFGSKPIKEDDFVVV